jgi:hypothetical protein
MRNIANKPPVATTISPQFAPFLNETAKGGTCGFRLPQKGAKLFYPAIARMSANSGGRIPLCGYLFTCRRPRQKSMPRPAPASSMDTGGSGIVSIIQGTKAETRPTPLRSP